MTCRAATSSTSSIGRRGLGQTSFVAFVINIAAVAASYVAQLVIARVVGATSYGSYSYVLAVVTILAYLAALGFDVSLLRMVASYRVRRAWGLMRGVISYAESRAVVCGLVIALLGILAVTASYRTRPPELTTTFLLGLILIPMWALLWVRTATVRALGGVVAALLPDRLLRDGMLAVLVWLAGRFLSERSGSALVMAATVVSTMAGVALASVMKRRWVPDSCCGSEVESAVPLWRGTTLPLVLIAVAESAMNRTGVVLLGWEGHTSEAGLFALIFNISSVVLLPRIAVNTRFAPMVSELFTDHDTAGLQALTTKATALGLVGGAGMALLLAVFAHQVLAQFGREFEDAIIPLQILLISQVVAAAAGSQIFLMTMTGHERGAATVMVLSAIGNAALSAMFISWFGVIGAAIATFMTLAGLNAGMAVFVHKHLGLRPGIVAIAGESRQAVVVGTVTHWTRMARGTMRCIGVLIALQLATASAAHGESVASRHFAANHNFDAEGHFLPGASGFDLADVSKPSQLDLLPDGVLALVWVGRCTGADEAFTRLVASFSSSHKVFGFYLMDDADPTGSYARRCSPKHLRAEADWVHSTLPAAKTFIMLMNLGPSCQPLFDKAYRPEESHIDLFGISPYPCRSESPYCNLGMIAQFVAAAEAAGIPRWRIVPTYQTFGGGSWRDDEGGRYQLPSVSSMQQLLAQWDQLLDTPVFDYAYSWGVQHGDRALENSSDLRGVMSVHNARRHATGE